MSIALNAADVVYTPDDVARDVVEFFKPSGKILEPCSGDGAFLKYLPGADWCEIEKGRDFFACHEHYDWIVGNPPYSIWSDWMRHSFEIADNIVYVIPINKAFNSDKMMREIADYGGICSIYVIGNGGMLGFVEVGFAIGAIHFQRGYRGGMFTVFRDTTVRERALRGNAREA
jgi:hypothetical protein